MSYVLTNNRDRGEFKIRIHIGIIGKKLNEKHHNDRNRIDLTKSGILPFKYINKEKEIVETDVCVKGNFYIGDELIKPHVGTWCATKVDNSGLLTEWGYCVDLDYEITTIEDARDIVREILEKGKTPLYAVGYLKTYVLNAELKKKVIDDDILLETLRNKSVFPKVEDYELGTSITVDGKKYTLVEDLELGKTWKPEEIIVKKKLIIKNKELLQKKYATNRDQEFNKTIRSYIGIIDEDVNRSRRGTNRIEKIKECIIPYDYIDKNGKRVTAKDICTNKDMSMKGTFIGPEGGKWCATEVDDTGLMKEWGYCLDESPKDIEKQEKNIWIELCNAIRYEQWNNVSKFSKQLLSEDYRTKSIFHTLLELCNRKRIAPHFERIKRIVNIEFIKLYPWTMIRTPTPDITQLVFKKELSNIILSKIEFLEKGLGLELSKGLVSKEPIWLLNYYYIVERLIVYSIVNEDNDFKTDILEVVKGTINIDKLNKILIDLESLIKSDLKKYIQQEGLELSGEIDATKNAKYIITNFSPFFGAISKENRDLYYDELSLKENLANQLAYYNLSFVEPREAQEKVLEEIEISEITEEVSKKPSIEKEWDDTDITFYKNYPELNDPLFYVNLNRKKEFRINKMSSWKDKTIQELCRDDVFELSPQQQWVTNYFNLETPYKGLLLYWGTGVGKTCASISIAERHLNYYKKYNKKILVILGTSTLENYKKELYNFKKEQIEIKKGLIPGTLQCTKDRYWMPIESNDPESMKKRRQRIHKKMEQDYEFITYGSIKGILTKLLVKRGLKLEIEDERKNLPKKPPTREGEEIKIGNITYISKKIPRGFAWKAIKNEDPVREERIRLAISEYFSNRLIIVDEIQNIRTAGEGGDQIAPQMLEKIIHYSSDLKIVLMSATPMFNNATEIVYILNLLLENDGKDKIPENQLFDSKENLKNPEYLSEISKGYISYVRGANPISFPKKLLPNQSPIDFIRESNEVYFPRPQRKMSGEPLGEDEIIRYNPLVKCIMSDYQEKIFRKAVLGEAEEGVLGDITNETFDINGKMISNIVYPLRSKFDKTDIQLLFGEKGFDRCFTENKGTYDYNLENAMIDNIPFLDHTLLETYSPKYKKILDNIVNTPKGIIFVYSEYKKGGSIPFALMLEQNGFQQLVIEGSLGMPTVKNRLHYDKKSNLFGGQKDRLKYVLLDGDLDPKKRAQLIERCNSDENREGQNIRVIIGTRVTGEGVDFARIRQIHILNPWDNFGRIDQTIGRGIRNCSHKDLLEEDRNVTIFLYSSHVRDNSVETTDEKIHRRAERKDIQMKEVEFVLRNGAIDCSSNYLANKYLQEDFGFEIGDKDYGRECGYKPCKEVYKCLDYNKIVQDDYEDLDTYNLEFHANREIEVYKQKIKKLFEKSVIYKLEHIQSKVEKTIPNFDESIFMIALDKCISQKEKMYDKYQRIGRIIFRDGYYLFQPDDLDKTIVLPEYYRANPLTLKPQKAEITLVEKEISDKKIKEWTNEVYDMLEEVEDDDEISYLLDRVKDSVMKQILLEWFRGEYNPTMIKNLSNHEKISSYLNEKDIIFYVEGNPKAVHWNRKISYEYVQKHSFNELYDGEQYKKQMITYNFDGYPLDKHVIGKLETMNEGKENSPFKQVQFKVIDFSFVENKANLKLDGKACMYYTREPMNKLLANLNIDLESDVKREEICKTIELILRKYNREEKERKVWWIESDKFYKLEKII